VPAVAEPDVTVRLAARLQNAVGAERVLTDPAQLRTYECAGLASFRVTPAVVVLAESRQDVVDTVWVCAEAGVALVARGSGTGLSGGALPEADGVLIVLSRVRRILRIDPHKARNVVEPGVVILSVSREAARHDLAYVPDPSSRQVCSIGGNLAENSGGAHCLKYGTVNHVMGAEIVQSDGQVVHRGGTAPEHPGYDLLGVLVGSEGTLGVAREVTLRLLRVPEAVQTTLVGFRSVEDAAGTVSDILAAGILPSAVEMTNALAIEAAEAAVSCGYPPGAVAVLVIKLDGPQVEVEAQFVQVAQLAQSRHAFETRIAADPAERALMGKGRKSALAAVGRISPAYFVQDGVIPRTRPPKVLAEISRLADEVGLRVANVFTVQVLDASFHGVPVGRLLADALDGPGTPVSHTTRTTASTN
jgi:glycolate oxidase